MAANQMEIVTRWAEEIGKDDPRLLRQQSGSLFVNPYEECELLSYGTHFKLVRRLPPLPRKRDELFLLNGDQGGNGGWGGGTTRHQWQVRQALRDRPNIIVPFSALRAAGIDLDSIVPLEIQEERFEKIPRIVPAGGRVHSYMRPARYGHPEMVEINTYKDHNVQLGADGRWHYEEDRHWLGASLFSARVEGRNRRAKFLSAFDDQETRPLYFLCELPPTRAAEVMDAFEALKPPAVMSAEASGLPVTRQGDVFAIPVGLTTRELRRMADYGGKRLHVLKTNHTATEVEVNGSWFGRGILRHEPEDRAPDHARRRMDDGKGWHLLVKNRVPEGRSHAGGIERSGVSRAWTLGGRVD